MVENIPPSAIMTPPDVASDDLTNEQSSKIFAIPAVSSSLSGSANEKPTHIFISCCRETSALVSELWSILVNAGIYVLGGDICGTWISEDDAGLLCTRCILFTSDFPFILTLLVP